MPPPKDCACWPAIARQIVLGLFPLRLQLRPFQRQSDPVGACLDGANRSIQFCRDHFGAGVRIRHSSKEVILLWHQPVPGEFNHVTTISPSPSAQALQDDVYSRWPFVCLWPRRSVSNSRRSKLCPFSSRVTSKVARHPRASKLGLRGAGLASLLLGLQSELDQAADGHRPCGFGFWLVLNPRV